MKRQQIGKDIFFILAGTTIILVLFCELNSEIEQFRVDFDDCVLHQETSLGIIENNYNVRFLFCKNRRGKAKMFLNISVNFLIDCNSIETRLIFKNIADSMLNWARISSQLDDEDFEFILNGCRLGISQWSCFLNVANNQNLTGLLSQLLQLLDLLKLNQKYDHQVSTIRNLLRMLKDYWLKNRIPALSVLQNKCSCVTWVNEKICDVTNL